MAGRTPKRNFKSGLAILGAGLLAAYLSKPAYILYRSYYMTTPNLVERYGKDSYALVTGASDGIGKGFCEAFAKQGMNLVLVARNKDKLEGVAQELRDKYSIKTQVLVLDFGKATISDYENLKAQVDNLDISILVNNVGAVDYSRLIHENLDEINYDIALNTTSALFMSRIFLPSLLNRSQKSALITTSSLAGAFPMPYMSAYSATKAASYYLSEALHMEFSNKIDVLSYLPGTVLTKAVTHEKYNYQNSTVEESVSGALKDLGTRHITHGSAKHELLVWSTAWTPAFIRRFAFKYLMKDMLKRRELWRD